MYYVNVSFILISVRHFPGFSAIQHSLKQTTSKKEESASSTEDDDGEALWMTDYATSNSTREEKDQLTIIFIFLFSCWKNKFWLFFVVREGVRPGCAVWGFVERTCRNLSKHVETGSNFNGDLWTWGSLSEWTIVSILWTMGHFRD